MPDPGPQPGQLWPCSVCRVRKRIIRKNRRHVVRGHLAEGPGGKWSTCPGSNKPPRQ